MVSHEKEYIEDQDHVVICLRFPTCDSLFVMFTIFQSVSQDIVKETNMNSAQTMSNSNPGKLGPVQAFAHSLTHPPSAQEVFV